MGSRKASSGSTMKCCRCSSLRSWRLQIIISSPPAHEACISKGLIIGKRLTLERDHKHVRKRLRISHEHLYPYCELCIDFTAVRNRSTPQKQLFFDLLREKSMVFGWPYSLHHFHRGHGHVVLSAPARLTANFSDFNGVGKLTFDNQRPTFFHTSPL